MSQLSPKEVVTEIKRIAEVRIHVERAIARMKSFHILDQWRASAEYEGHSRTAGFLCMCISNRFPATPSKGQG